MGVRQITETQSL